MDTVKDKKNLLAIVSRALKGKHGANLTLLFTLIIMLLIFSSMSPYFLTVRNLFNITRSIAITGVAAVGETIVLIGGGIDLSVSAVMAASGMAAAVAIRAGLPFGIAFMIALILGLFVGLINGLIITKIRINPLITTLGMGMIVRGFTYIGYSGGTLTVPVEGFTELGRGRFLDIIPYPVIILLFVYVVMHIVLTRTLFGRMVYAIGGNPIACRLAGINVDRWRLVVYGIGGLFAGFAGYMLASLVGSAMANAAIGAELDIIAAVILGGASLSGGEGNLIGTLLGTLVLGTLTNGLIMMNVQVFWQMVARGTALMLALFIDARRSGGYR
jgi:ribose/xylose/arabinose/galactoside ABC-type transport system permease subunit